MGALVCMLNVCELVSVTTVYLVFACKSQAVHAAVCVHYTMHMAKKIHCNSHEVY